MLPTERSNISFFILLVSTVLSMSYFLVSKFKPVGTVAGVDTSHPPVVVSFFFGGGGQFKLYGYSSPQALVSLESGAGYDQTRARADGYFEFTNRYSPISPLEVCLTSQDQLGRLSSPVCLPPFPNDRYIVIGPVILSPTLSFDKSDYYVGDEVILSGQTIPNTDVSLNLFTKEGGKKLLGMETKNQLPNSLLNLPSIFQFIKPVEAFSFPNLATKSDSKGNFSVSLPSTSAKTYRLFAQTNFDAQTSPNSLVLQFQILPVWMIIVKFFLFIWSLIKSRLLEICILAQIGALIYYIIRHYFQPHQLMLAEHKIVKQEKYPLVKR